MKQRWRALIPATDKAAYIHPTAVLTGDVNLDEGCTVWPTAVLRGDDGAIYVGADTNVQDGVVIHGGARIGQAVTIGHRAVLHGCTVGDRALIGIGAIVLDGAVVGEDAIIAAGAVVSPSSVIPAGSVVMGVPGKIRRQITEEELTAGYKRAEEYRKLGLEYANSSQDIDE